MVWVPGVLHVLTKTRTRCAVAPCRSGLPTPTPSMNTRACPRFSPRGATHATDEPVNVNVAVAPRAVAKRVEPPDAELLLDLRHVPLYVIALLASSVTTARTARPVTVAAELPALSVAPARNCQVAVRSSSASGAVGEIATAVQAPPLRETAAVRVLTPDAESVAVGVTSTGTLVLPSCAPSARAATGADTTGGVRSSVIVAEATEDHRPTESCHCAYTVCAPSVESASVHGIDDDGAKPVPVDSIPPAVADEFDSTTCVIDAACAVAGACALMPAPAV